MRIRTLRGLTAVLLAVAVMVPMTARPAAAQTGNPYIDYAVATIQIVRSLFGGGMSTEEAVRQINQRIAQAEAAIIANNQRIAAAEARRCSTTAVTTFPSFLGLEAGERQAFAREATDCVARIESLLGTITDKHALNTLGTANQVITPIALAASRAAGFQTGPIINLLIVTNQGIVAALAPACETTGVSSWPVYTEIYTCVAFNGDTAAQSRRRLGSTWFDPPINQVAVQDAATANTSRAVAQAILPVLAAL